VASESKVRAMRHALGLAMSPDAPRGPNPRVGAVIVGTDGDVVGEGYHRGAGTAHAEVEALRAAGERARGGTAFVTLEPCDHHGRTGPCSLALLEAGISRVVFAQADSTATATGGAARLQAAGVAVESGLLAEEAAAVNEEFSFSMDRRRPFVTWKFAATLDGRSAAVDGTSRWITGADARADVHRLRSEVDAIAVGTGTVLADDPQLTVRAPGAVTPSPLRAIVGRREIPATAKVLDDSAPTLRVTSHDPVVVLHELFARDVRHLLLEGGPTLAAAFLAAGVVNRVVAYLAPTLLGAGPLAVADFGVATIADALRLERMVVEMVGRDVRVTASVPEAAPPPRGQGAS
jgi:diaminohydroxyphosphoribosylaminopyrimidine deaminase / 5-amino-6-(5-phosphoribosylamino)uracil reductase